MLVAGGWWMVWWRDEVRDEVEGLVRQPNPLLLLIEFDYLRVLLFEEFPGLASSIQLRRNKALVQPSTSLTWLFQHSLRPSCPIHRVQDHLRTLLLGLPRD